MRAERTLLLVDDEVNILRSLTRTLRRDGYNILTASGGEEGLAVLSENSVEVIVSDQRMPGMAGSEFLSRARENYPDTVRIMLSGYTELNSVTDAINQGAIYKFLTKPWEDELLRTNIQDAFEYYDLRHANKILSQELSELNKDLEQRVSDRTRELTLSMRSLQLGQEVLEELPCAVIGIDKEAMIVNANELAHTLLDQSGSGMIGKEAKQVLPKDLYEATQGDNNTACSQMTLEYEDKYFAINIKQLGTGENYRGIVIACMLIEGCK